MASSYTTGKYSLVTTRMLIVVSVVSWKVQNMYKSYRVYDFLLGLGFAAESECAYTELSEISISDPGWLYPQAGHCEFCFPCLLLYLPEWQHPLKPSHHRAAQRTYSGWYIFNAFLPDPMTLSVTLYMPLIFLYTVLYMSLLPLTRILTCAKKKEHRDQCSIYIPLYIDILTDWQRQSLL